MWKIIKQRLETLKLLAVFVFSIGLWVLNLFIDSSGNNYTLRLLVIVYTLVIASSLYIIFSKRIFIKRDIITGFVLGAIASIPNLDIAVFFVTFFAYVASMIILNDSEFKILFLKEAKFKEIVIILTIVLAVIMLFCYSYGVEVVLYSFIQTLRPAFSEEVVFRLFLFAISILIIDKNKKHVKSNMFLIYLIMIIPFTIAHYSEQVVEFGLIGFFRGMNALNIIHYAFIASYIMLKRDLLTSIVFHIVVNIVGATNMYSTMYATVENIWQNQSPTVIQMILEDLIPILSK